MSTRPEPITGEQHRLINLAYRLLGSLAEAEDAVQETYARWYAMSTEQREAIASPGAWLTTVVTRVCLDLLGSARARRETYVGEWLPEPVPAPAEWATGRAAGPMADPADQVTLDESASPAWWCNATASQLRCTRSTSRATGSRIYGPSAIPRSSGPG